MLKQGFFAEVFKSGKITVGDELKKIYACYGKMRITIHLNDQETTIKEI